ncbi:MAG TPA: thioesterase family protein [Candidatus Paceibacterota bacterium]
MHFDSKLVVGPEFIDQYGHVNYKRVPDLLEPIQDDLLREVSTSFKIIESGYGLRSFVRKLAVDYKGQLKKDDLCDVSTEVTLGKTSMLFRQEVYKEGILVAELEMIVVLVNADGVPTLIPAQVRAQLGG